MDRDVSEGRWGGRLTSRPLPAADASIDALPDADRAELVAVWLARASSERRVADAFDVIHSHLVALRAGEVTRLAKRAVDDEHRHAELCRVVASRVAGRELDAPAPLPLVVPEHRGAPERVVPHLHVIGHCAMNETFASAFLEVSLAAARGALARAALRELLSDEIDHARIGWAHLAALGESGRAEIGAWLLPLVRANLKMWRDTPRPYPTAANLNEQGAPSAPEVERALLGAVRELIVPGLSRLGLRTGAISAWLAEGAPTGA